MREEQWVLEEFVVAAQDGDLLAHSTRGLLMDVDTVRFHGMQVSDMYNSSHLTIGSGVLEFDVGGCCIRKRLKSTVELPHIRINSIQELSRSVQHVLQNTVTRSMVSAFLLVIQEPAERMLARVDIVHLVIHSTGDHDIRRSGEFDEATRDANGRESEEIVQGVTQTAEFSGVALEKGLKVR